MISLNKRLLVIIISAGALLSIPLVAMQFSNQVDWSFMDFIVMGGLLISLGIIIDFILRKVKKKGHRILMLIGALLVFLLVWAELAVGIFGSPLAGS